MVQSLELGTSKQNSDQGGIRRINRLPVIIVIGIVFLFLGVVIIGLSWRGFSFHGGGNIDSASSAPATTFGESDQRDTFQPWSAPEPLKVDVSEAINNPAGAATTANSVAQTTPANGGSDLYAAAKKSGLMGQNADPNEQTTEEDFFNADIKKLGYLPNPVVPQMSAFELKRGSVIPATLITGLNSDLLVRITAQISRNVYDSSTGYRLPIPKAPSFSGDMT